MYDEEQIKQNRKERSSAADPVDLPHCEGLEVSCPVKTLCGLPVCSKCGSHIRAPLCSCWIGKLSVSLVL
jgi:hypothetical protein